MNSPLSLLKQKINLASVSTTNCIMYNIYHTTCISVQM